MSSAVELVRRYLLTHARITSTKLRDYAYEHGVHMTPKQASDILRGLARRNKLRPAAFSEFTDSGQHASVYYPDAMPLRVRPAASAVSEQEKKEEEPPYVFLLQLYWRQFPCVDQ